MSNLRAKRYTSEQKAEAVALYLDGATLVDAASSVGASSQALRVWLNNAGKRPRTPSEAAWMRRGSRPSWNRPDYTELLQVRLTSEQKDKIRTYGDGLSLAETIRQWADSL